MTRFDAAILALKESQRDAEKEATRMEIVQPELSKEARTRADGLADARRLLESISDLSKSILLLQEGEK